jgi:hypothetical protein
MQRMSIKIFNVLHYMQKHRFVWDSQYYTQKHILTMV